MLARQGLNPLTFEANVRDELLAQQMQEAYAQNGFAANSVTNNVIRLNEQQRVVSVSTVSFQPFMSLAKVDDAEVKAYYEQNSGEFQVSEQAKVEYVKFSSDDLLTNIEVKNEEIRNYYDSHTGEFGTPEERRAAHILITVNKSASQAEQDAAKTKAELLQQQARQDPDKFAELARKNSQDTGSAVNGGDLGFFGLGMMVKPFEDAAFALKVGEISGLVKSDFGYHIIKLLAVKPSRILPFDEVRAGIANKLREQKAADRFAELAEKFSNTVYEQSDSLKPAANLVGTKIERSGWIIKGAVAAAPWTAKMLEAIFSDQAIKDKRNTAAIEVASNTLAAARVLEYKPASVRPLNEVSETIRKKLLLRQALESAVKQGKALREQLIAGNKPALSWAAAQTVTRTRHGSLDLALVRKIFQVNTASLPQYVGEELPQAGYVLVRIEAVKEGESVNEDKVTSYQQQLRQLTGEEMFRAYLAEARQQATIKVNLPAAAPAQP